MSRGADLQRLMVIADLYARKLAAGAGPPRVLMLERDGELEVVVLDGPDRDAAAEARRQLAQRRATSAALLFQGEATLGDAVHTVFCILGETDEGATVARRYRVRPIGRRRRLTPLPVDEGLAIEEVFRPLFPVHLRPPGADDAPADPPDLATSASAAPEEPVTASPRQTVAA